MRAMRIERWKNLYVPSERAFIPLICSNESVFSYFILSLGHEQLSFLKGKNINRRNESVDIYYYCTEVNSQSILLLEITNNINQLFHLVNSKFTSKAKMLCCKLFNCFFSVQMAALWNNNKTEAVIRDSQEEHFKNNLSHDTSIFGVTEAYITQCLKESEKK